ncbi:MAG: hypothetical protein K0R24_2343, partial [Gammaproteobacteria bacterium]|nr:hypothetical protein [Gammaproteobacteria bacterium]
SYQNSPVAIRNHEILQQLRNVLLHTAMTSDYKKPGRLQTMLEAVDSHLYTAIQAEPKLQQQYVLQDKYARYFNTFYSSEQKENTLAFMRALTMVETHLLNADDETIIEFYKNNPMYGIIAQKRSDVEKEENNLPGQKGVKVRIEDLKAEWIKNGAHTIGQLKVLAPALFAEYDLQFLAAGNNITWRLKNKNSGEYLILRASKQKLTNLDHIATLKNTPGGEYFSPEYVTLVGAIDQGDRMEDYTLSLIKYCSRGNLQHVRKNIPTEDNALIQKEAIHLLSSVFAFCENLIDENGYFTDGKLSNFLVGELSDLKSLRVCAEGDNVHSLSRDDITGDITPLYAPPEWEGNYEVMEGSSLPDRNAHKPGKIYYDNTTRQYSLLGYNGEFYQGLLEELGERKKQGSAIKKIEKEIRYDMDKFMSYQLGLALYDFLTGLTITLEGETAAERNGARAEALEQLKTFKESGKFDYSAAVFQGSEGQVLRELCTALLKTNPKERMSVKEAVSKLTVMKREGAKAQALHSLHEAAYLSSQSMLQDAMGRYKAHNEQFNSDPNFSQTYQRMKLFQQEIAEAKMVTQDTAFLAHALEAEALRLKTWVQHAAAQPQKAEHFYPHYAKSLLNEGFTAHLRGCAHTVRQLSTAEVDPHQASEKNSMLNEITAIHDGLESKMNVFLHAHNNDVAVTPIVEFAKLFEAASKLKSYIEVLKMNFSELRLEDYQEVQKHLAALGTQSTTPEALAQNLKKEALYLHSISYCKHDEAQGVPAYLIALRQSLSYHFLEKTPNITDNFSQNLEQYLATLFKPEEGNGADLMMHAKRYEQKLAGKEYGKAYVEALEVNRQVTRLYTKLLGDDSKDPIVAEMKALRAEMNEALKSGIVDHRGSAETLQKVNLELINSIGYLAGPRVSSFKPVHKKEEWQQLKEDSVNVASTKKKWAQRVLMGVAMPLALVLMVGTGGVLAVPSIAAEIASAVSPTIANSAANLVSFSSIWARAKVVFSGSKAVKDSDDLFNTAAGVAHNLVKPAVKAGAQEVSESHPNKLAAPVLSPNHSGLFHHGEGHPVQKQKEGDSEGDSGAHPIHK